MSWHFLQGQEVASWEGDSLDGAPSALLRLIPTLEKFCSPDKETDTLRGFQSGMTLEHLTADRGGEGLESSQRDGRVKTSHVQGRAKGSKESAQGSGWKLPGSWGKFDPGTSLVRTRQCCFITGDGELYSGICPRWGSASDGELLERTIYPMPHTKESEFGSLLPTPVADDISHRKKKYAQGGTALSTAIGGPVNPAFSEWMMAWPIGWTDLEPLEMDKFQQWLSLHGGR